MSNELDTLFEEFETAWAREAAPELSEYLPPPDSPLRREALYELIRIDLEFRWRSSQSHAGEKAQRPWTLLDYTRSFPELTTAELVASGLVAEEYRARARWGDRPEMSEYAERYDVEFERLAPQLAAVDAELTGEQSLPATDEGVSPTVVGSTRPYGDSRTVAGRSAANAASQTTGQFGDYDLLREIARGGMGVVYQARQRKLNRIVALKMIRSGELADADEVRRFHAEAEAAAQLDHPHIVPIFEVGEQDGQQFFSMGFVEGAGLDARIQDGPLPPDEAARLMRTIALAVQYAHEKGIVHRDLKPANVLIDAEGQPRVTDFGLAKNVSADSKMTATGQVLGTPSYMPPEQAAGRIDEIGPPADVYGLGAMLYATLTGRPPFQSASVMETLQQVLERAPVAPRQLNPAVDKDLETICLKCLEKSAARRYATAGELAAELDRFLADEPILARPVGRLERAGRWCRRNPLGATVVALLAVLAAGGSGTAYSQMRLSRQLRSSNTELTRSLAAEQAATRLARANERRARENARRANRNLDRADEVVSDFLIEIGRKSGVLSLYPATRPLQKQLLEKGRAYFAKLIAENPQAGLSPRLAQANYHLAAVQTVLSGQRNEAIGSYLKSRTDYTRLQQKFPDEPKYRVAIARLQTNLGDLYQDGGDEEKALACYQESADRFGQLFQDAPDSPVYRHGLAVSLINLGSLRLDRGTLQSSIDFLRKARGLLQALNAEFANNIDYQSDLAICHSNIARYYSSRENHARALAEYDKARAIWSSLLREYPRVTTFQKYLAVIDRATATLRLQAGEPRKALEAYQRAGDRFQQLARENPRVADYQKQLAENHNTIAAYHQQVGQWTQAIAEYRLAAEVLNRLVKDNSDAFDYQYALAVNLGNLSLCYWRQQELTAAIDASRRAIAGLEKLVSRLPDNVTYRTSLASRYANHGVILQNAGKQSAANIVLKKALALYEPLVRRSPDLPKLRLELAQAVDNLANGLARNGKPSEAVPHYKRALSLKRLLVREHQDVVSYRISLAGSVVNYSKLKAVPTRLTMLAEAIALLEEVLEHDPQNDTARRYLRNAHWDRARAFDSQQRYVAAAAAWQRAAEFSSARDAANMQVGQSQSLARSGRHLEAVAALRPLLTSKSSKSLSMLRGAVRTYSIALRAVIRDRTLSHADRAAYANRYFATALSILKAMAGTGAYPNASDREQLAHDPDFGPLRTQRIFREFASSIGVPLPARARKPRSATAANR